MRLNKSIKIKRKNPVRNLIKRLKHKVETSKEPKLKAAYNVLIISLLW